MQYHDVALNRGPIAAYADRLLAAEALVLIYPVWNEGFPAILKGFFDRVFIPGVSFTIGPDGAPVPKLAEAAKACCGLHLRRQSHDQFLAWRPAQARGETLGAFDAWPHRSLRLPCPLRYGSFQPRATGRLPRRRSSEHLRLGRLTALRPALQDPRLRPRGCGGRRKSDPRHKASG